MAEEGDTETRVQIILLKANGRLFRIDDPEMAHGADHFAEMTATAPPWVNFNPHLPCPDVIA